MSPWSLLRITVTYSQVLLKHKGRTSLFYGKTPHFFVAPVWNCFFHVNIWVGKFLPILRLNMVKPQIMSLWQKQRGCLTLIYHLSSCTNKVCELSYGRPLINIINQPVVEGLPNHKGDMIIILQFLTCSCFVAQTGVFPNHHWSSKEVSRDRGNSISELNDIRSSSEP